MCVRERKKWHCNCNGVTLYRLANLMGFVLKATFWLNRHTEIISFSNILLLVVPFFPLRSVPWFSLVDLVCFDRTDARIMQHFRSITHTNTQSMKAEHTHRLNCYQRQFWHDNIGILHIFRFGFCNTHIPTDDKRIKNETILVIAQIRKITKSLNQNSYFTLMEYTSRMLDWQKLKIEVKLKSPRTLNNFSSTNPGWNWL